MWKTLNLLKFNSNDHWNVLTCPVFDEFKFSNWTQISCWTLNNYFFSFQNCNTPSFSCLNAADTAFVSLGRHCSTSNITLGSKGETGDRQTQSFRGCSPMTQYRWLIDVVVSRNRWKQNPVGNTRINSQGADTRIAYTAVLRAPLHKAESCYSKGFQPKYSQILILKTSGMSGNVK